MPAYDTDRWLAPDIASAAAILGERKSLARLAASIETCNETTLAALPCRHPQGRQVPIVEDAALVTDGPLIHWIGPRAELPPGDYAERIDLGGAWLTPG